MHQIREKVQQVGISNCYISSVTYTELLYGAEKSTQIEQNLKRLSSIKENFRLVPFEIAMHEFAKQKVHLKRIGRPVSDFDILIGSTAIAAQMTLVTNNVKDFENLEGILIENWVD